jgi:Flp pilus assembly pilin Flp
MIRLANYVVSFVRKDEGQDLLEYALLVALIAIGAVTAVTFAGDQVEAVFNSIAEMIPTGA